MSNFANFFQLLHTMLKPGSVSTEIIASGFGPIIHHLRIIIGVANKIHHVPIMLIARTFTIVMNIFVDRMDVLVMEAGFITTVIMMSLHPITFLPQFAKRRRMFFKSNMFNAYKERDGT